MLCGSLLAVLRPGADQLTHPPACGPVTSNSAVVRLQRPQLMLRPLALLQAHPWFGQSCCAAAFPNPGASRVQAARRRCWMESGMTARTAPIRHVRCADDGGNSGGPAPRSRRRIAPRLRAVCQAASGSGWRRVRGSNTPASRGCRQFVAGVSAASSGFAAVGRAAVAAFADLRRDAHARRSATRPRGAIALPYRIWPNADGTGERRFARLN